MRRRRSNGFTLIELLIVVALAGLFLLFAGPDLMGALRRRDLDNLTLEVADLMERCRWRAMSERSYAGIFFERLAVNEYRASLYLDGNNNGIRIADIENGTETRFHGPVSLTRSGGDVGVGTLTVPVPEIPPKEGTIEPNSDPVRFGHSDIISFSPDGDSSSGTLYLACPSQRWMYALVLYGVTAKWTTWKYDSNHEWQMVGDR